MTSREKFEAWYLENWGHTEDDHETLFERNPDSDEEYYRLGVRMAHGAWQASELASQQNLTDMAVQLANAESKCRELTAENVTLNDKMNRLATWPGIEFYSSSWEFCNLDGNDALEFMCDVQTPATDAFLAEVRAQVWIEGNEPAEFGRYWVRCETDVGPQYCSAKWMEHNFCAGSDTNIHKIWLADHSRSINSLKGVTHYTMLPEPIEGGAK
ncbi:hypothetical protein [Citrobacter freundii]|uniref:hypothetical protein n=1 Tax=Citrobacter freundii TaxID=546 RepID=UPI001BCFEF94|nr:hypothetical protein [Citrobacter freundii]